MNFNKSGSNIGLNLLPDYIANFYLFFFHKKIAFCSILRFIKWNLVAKIVRVPFSSNFIFYYLF